MGLFDSVRDVVGGGDDGAEDGDTAGDGDGLSMPGEREPSPTAFRNSAIDAVDQWSDYDLDFSLDSLARLDRLAAAQGPAIDVVRDERGENAAAKRHMAYTIQAGSYLGETLVRRCDGRWVEDGDTWSVRIAEGRDAFDVDVFEVAAHSFAREPAFGEVRDRLGDDTGDGARSDADEQPSDDSTAEPTGASGDDDARSGEGPPLDTADIAGYAEELATVWSGYDLDFAPQSLARLDSLAATEWDDDRFADAEAGGEDMDSGMFTELLKQLGSYYGEVLVREHGGQWVRSGDTIAVRVSGDEGRTTVARVFDVARDSLTGPSQFAADYNAVTDEADVYAPQVAEHGAAMPTSGGDSPVDNEGPDVDRVAPADGEPAAGTDASDRADAGTQQPAPRDDPAVGGDDQHPQDGTGATASVDEAGDDAGGDTGETAASGGDFDVAAAAKEVVADDLTEAGPDDDGSQTDVADTDGTAEPEEPTEAAETVEPGGSATAVDAAESAGTAEPPGSTERDPTAADAGSGGTAGDDTVDDAADTVTLDLSDEDGGESTALTPADVEDDAAAFAATWPGYDLDYTPPSLERLDRLVSEEYPDVADRDRGFRRARAAEVGGYLAAVLDSGFETEWETTAGSDPTLRVRGPGGSERVDPVATAMARFRGEEALVAVYERVRRAVGGA